MLLGYDDHYNLLNNGTLKFLFSFTQLCSQFLLHQTLKPKFFKKDLVDHNNLVLLFVFDHTYMFKKR
jgi:hypothetical protein